jgi:preprotein translocase subunit SecG
MNGNTSIRRYLSREERAYSQEYEAELNARALGFVIPLVALMIIGIEVGNGIGALIGSVAGGIIGLTFNSFLTRYTKWVSTILIVAALVGVIANFFRGF